MGRKSLLSSRLRIVPWRGPRLAGLSAVPNPLTDKIPGQCPKIIHVVMRQYVSEEVANPLARWNISVNFLPPRENFLQRSMAQQIARDLMQRLARIKYVSIRIHPRKHRGVALEAAEAQQRLD